jgi:predicted ester cyclase
VDARYDFLPDNKALLRYFVEEVQQKGRLELIDDFVAADYVNHTPSPGQPAHGPESVRWIMEVLHGAVPDVRVEIRHQIAEGPDVATYKVFSGTHTGTFLGIEPTGRRLEFPVFDLIRFRDRMLVEHWAVIDEGAMLRTLGLID